MFIVRTFASQENKRGHSQEEDLDIDLEDVNDSDPEMVPKEGKRTSKLGCVASASDNPVTYCVEGTPLSLSRISSVSSISSDEIDQHIDK